MQIFLLPSGVSTDMKDKASARDGRMGYSSIRLEPHLNRAMRACRRFLGQHWCHCHCCCRWGEHILYHSMQCIKMSPPCYATISGLSLSGNPQRIFFQNCQLLAHQYLMHTPLHALLSLTPVVRSRGSTVYSQANSPCRINSRDMHCTQTCMWSH